jgi:hypothetical protein
MNQYPPWRPIETAPKDQTSVLLCVAGYEPALGCFSLFYDAWVTYTYENVDEDSDLDGDYQPTHWMPLPPTSTLEPT